MAQIQEENAAVETTVHPMQQMLVETKAALTDEQWTPRPDLECARCRWGAAPILTEATLADSFGAVKRQREDAFNERWPLDLDGHYVRLSIVTDRVDEPVPLPFLLLCTEVQIGVDGEDIVPRQGTLTWQCHGMEHLLDGARIVGATVMVHDGAGGSEEAEITTCPAFNRAVSRRPGHVEGNRSEAEVTGGVYAFAQYGEYGYNWTALDVLKYLVYHYAPARDGLSWAVKGPGLSALNQYVAEWHLEGDTLRGAINRLVDRRRGLVWSLRWDEDNATVILHVSTVLDEDVVSGSVTIEGNDETLDFLIADGDDDDAAAYDTRLIQASVRQLWTHVYERFIVYGAPVRVTASFSYADGTLTQGWASALETAYRNGLSDAPDENDRARSAEDYDDVFRLLTVPSDWSRYCGNGEGGTPAVASITIQDDGTLATTTLSPFYPRGVRFLDWLPWEADAATDHSPARYRRPFVACYDNEAEFAIGEADKGNWCYSHAHGKEGVPPVRVEIADQELAVRLVGAYNHLFARTHWDPATDGPTMMRGGWTHCGDHFDWDECILTASLELSHRSRVVLDLSGDPPAADARTLTVVLPDAQLWYVVPNTVQTVTDSGNLFRATGGAVRDDTDRLRIMAALLKTWYGRPRATARVAYHELLVPCHVGAVMSSLSTPSWQEPVNTIISSITWENGATTVETGYWQLDLQAMAYDLPGVPDAGAAIRDQAAIAADVAALAALE